MTGLVSCTLDCNLKCEYCFEGNGDKDKCPDLEKINLRFEKGIDYIDSYIDELYELNNREQTTIIWHGGEPTLIDPELLSEVMNRQHEKQHKIKWQIQTNGTLIPKYVPTFKKYKVYVGISIDGLKKHHDKYRIMKNGNPTFDIINKNIDILIENKIPFSVLVTITDNNVHDLIDIYKFLAKKNISFNFNALYPRCNENDKADLQVQDFSNAICELFDYWIEDQENKIIIGPFEQIIEGILKPDRGVPACNWQKNCLDSFVAIDAQGDVYPCEHWVGYEDMKSGNITDGLKNIIENRAYFDNRVDQLIKTDCINCPIFKFCYGGCPWNAYMLLGDVNRADLSICDGRKKMIAHIYQYLKKYYKGEIPELEL